MFKKQGFFQGLCSDFHTLSWIFSVQMASYIYSCGKKFDDFKDDHQTEET